jgi:hypothetical protein
VTEAAPLPFGPSTMFVFSLSLSLSYLLFPLPLKRASDILFPSASRHRQYDITSAGFIDYVSDWHDTFKGPVWITEW